MNDKIKRCRDNLTNLLKTMPPTNFMAETVVTAIEALSDLSKLRGELEAVKKLNDNLTRNVFVEDSPALKVMVETAAQQKDIIAKLQKEIDELRKLLDWVLPKDWDRTSTDYLVKREEYERVRDERDKLQAELSRVEKDLNNAWRVEVMLREEIKGLKQVISELPRSEEDIVAIIEQGCYGLDRYQRADLARAICIRKE